MLPVLLVVVLASVAVPLLLGLCLQVRRRGRAVPAEGGRAADGPRQPGDARSDLGAAPAAPTPRGGGRAVPGAARTVRGTTTAGATSAGTTPTPAGPVRARRPGPVRPPSRPAWDVRRPR